MKLLFVFQLFEAVMHASFGRSNGASHNQCDLFIGMSLGIPQRDRVALWSGETCNFSPNTVAPLLLTQQVLGIFRLAPVPALIEVNA